MFMLAVDCKVQGSADVSFNYTHAQVRQPKACSYVSDWPAHAAAAID